MRLTGSGRGSGNKYRNADKDDPRRYSAVLGRRFDSIAERRRAEELWMMLTAGAIADLRFQVRHPLVVNGMRVTTYVSDFEYEDRAGVRHIEDVKGMRTPLYKLKKKLIKALEGIEIEEIEA